MAERIVSSRCYGCVHLQKENPLISGDMAMYQCTSQERNGRCVGWVQKDKPESGLKNMGGSCCNKLYPGDVVLCHARFKDVTARWMYCGIVENGKLMYNKNKMEYKVVPKDWFRAPGGRIKTGISVLKQNEAQLEASRRVAKKRKQRWCKEHCAIES